MTLKLYFDLMSQPSRAVYMFLRMTGVPFEPKPVALRKMEHKQEEFKKLNPFSLVPVIDDGGFKLTESIAISKYVIRKYNLPDHWFPQELEKQTRVEEYLHWQHFNTRANAAFLFQNLLIIPKATGKPIDEAAVAMYKKRVARMVSQLETYFLKDRLYLTGNEISLADIFGICELMQLYACHQQHLYEKSPIVTAWMERVKKETNPYFDEAHKMTYKVHQMYPAIAANL